MQILRDRETIQLSIVKYFESLETTAGAAVLDLKDFGLDADAGFNMNDVKYWIDEINKTLDSIKEDIKDYESTDTPM